MPVRIIVDVIEAPALALIAQTYFMTADLYDELIDPTFEAVGLLAEQYARNFETESSGGVAWEPWSIFYGPKRSMTGEYFTDPVTGERTHIPFGELVAMGERAAAGSGGILDLSGALREAATSVEAWDVDSGKGNASAVLENVPFYGVYHVTGVPEIFLPERNWAFVSDDVLDEIDEKYFEHFDEVMQ